MESRGERPPLIVVGRYLKQSRDVSQSQWIIEGKRICPMSVEEAIGEPLRAMLQASTYKFMAAGREDSDVRMLGPGRPFAVELRGCLREPEALQAFIDGHLLLQHAQQQGRREEERQPQGRHPTAALHLPQQRQGQQTQHCGGPLGRQQGTEKNKQRRETCDSRDSERNDSLRDESGVAGCCSSDQDYKAVTAAVLGAADSPLLANSTDTPPHNGGGAVASAAVARRFVSAANASAGASAAADAVRESAAGFSAPATAPVDTDNGPAAAAGVDCTEKDIVFIRNTDRGSHSCSQRRVEGKSSRCRSAISSSSSNAVSDTARSESRSSAFKRRCLSSNSDGGGCQICAAAFEETDRASCMCEHAEDSLTWRSKRLLPVCPFFVSLQRKQLKRYPEVEIHRQQYERGGQQHPGAPQQQQQHPEMRHQQQQGEQQLRQTTAQQLQQQHHQQQAVQERHTRSGAQCAAESRAPREWLRHVHALVEDRGCIAAASGERLTDLLDLRSLTDEAASAQRDGALLAPSSSEICTSKVKGTEKGERAGSPCSRNLVNCSTLSVASVSDSRSPRVSLCRSLSYSWPQTKPLLPEGERHKYAKEEAVIFGGAPAVIVFGMRLVLPQGRQQQIEKALQRHPQYVARQTQPQQQQKNQQQRQEQQRQEQQGQRQIQQSREETEARLASQYSSASMFSKHTRVGKEVRLALQHAAEEKIKHYECLVYSQSPVTPQQLQDLQLKYTDGSRKQVSRNAYRGEAVDRKGDIDAAADAAAPARVAESVDSSGTTEKGVADVATATSGEASAVAEGHRSGEATPARGATGNVKQSRSAVQDVCVAAKQGRQAALSKAGGGGEDVAAAPDEVEGTAAGEGFAVSATEVRTANSAGEEQGRGAAAERKSAGAATDMGSGGAGAAEAQGLEEATETGRGLLLFQKTPLRVLHRRSLAERRRMVYGMDFTFLHPHLFVCRLRTQAGTYIKEFVHGDYGRTAPSLSSLLHTQCRVLLLDVVDIVGCVPLHSSNTDWESSERSSCRPFSGRRSKPICSKSNTMDRGNTGSGMNIDSSYCVDEIRDRNSSSTDGSNGNKNTDDTCGRVGYGSSLAEGNALLEHC